MSFLVGRLRLGRVRQIERDLARPRRSACRDVRTQRLEVEGWLEVREEIGAPVPGRSAGELLDFSPVARRPGHDLQEVPERRHLVLATHAERHHLQPARGAEELLELVIPGVDADGPEALEVDVGEPGVEGPHPRGLRSTCAALDRSHELEDRLAILRQELGLRAEQQARHGDDAAHAKPRSEQQGIAELCGDLRIPGLAPRSDQRAPQPHRIRTLLRAHAVLEQPGEDVQGDIARHEVRHLARAIRLDGTRIALPPDHQPLALELRDLDLVETPAARIGFPRRLLCGEKSRYEEQ